MNKYIYTNEIYFAKTKPQAIIPSKREEDGCFDLYACFDEDEFIIYPHTVSLVPTGIASAFSPNYRIAFRERGSNTKSVLQVMAGQIDSGFRGEWFVALYNANDCCVKISQKADKVNRVRANNKYDVLYVPYSKAICQFAVEEVPTMEIKETTYDEIMSFKSERGTGMLGSSKK